MACKGQDISLQALKRCEDKYGFYDWTFDMIGDTDVRAGKLSAYAKDAQSLQALAHELKVAKKVSFRGKQSRDSLYANLCEYDLLLHPSRYEGFGLTVVEAMAAGVPVLASAVDGPRELIGDESYGFLFPNEDIEACAAAIHRITENYADGDIFTKVDAALPMARERYSIESMVQSLESIYTDAVRR